MADDKYLNLEGLTHFKEKLDDTFAEKGDLDSKQDLITDTNKLDYALIDNTPSVPTKMSELINDKNYISLSSEGTEDVQVYTKDEVDQLLQNIDPIDPTESDPIFTASVAAGITSDDITNWNGKTTVTESTVSGWGFTKTSGTYSKPEGGIPKTDLTSAVQTSLGLADTALQSFTETDPTVPAWAKTENKPTYTADEVGALASTVTHLSGDIAASEKGANNGVAQLDSTGKVPSSQLPSFVDDVLEYNTKSSFPASGESGKIYIDTTTNITYRWGGSDYVAIGSDLALGETSSTAYAGDKGAANATAISTHTGNSDIHVTTTNKTAWNAKYDKPSGGIPKTDLASAVQASLGLADTALQSYTETDPVFSASAAAGIKSTDISNWNSKTSNVGTITGITMNGVSKGTSGVVDLGDVVTDIESLDVEEVALDNNTLQIINGKLTVVLPIFDGEEVQ